MGLKCLYLGAVALLATSIATWAAPPSFADLAKLETVSQLQLSPNGKLLAATVPVDAARSRVTVIDLDSMKVTASLQLRSSIETLSGFMWVNDKYLLLSIAYRPGGLAEAVPTGELATLNAETGRLTYTFGQRGEMKTGSRLDKAGGEQAAAFPIARVPGSNNALVEVARFGVSAELPGVRLLNVVSGSNKRVTQAPVRNPRFVTDHTGEVRIAYGGMGASLADQRVHVRDAKGKWGVFEAASVTKRQLWPAYFAPDNTHFYANVTRPGKADALLRINIDDKTESEVYSGTVDPDGLVYSFDRKDVVAVVVRDGESRLHWLQPKSAEAALVRAMEAQMPDHLVYPISSSEDGQRVLLLASSDRNAGDFFLYDRTNKKASLVMSARNWLPIESLAKSEPISFTSRDGMPLHGYLTMPTAQQEKPPLVVVPHGGPYGVRDRWDFNPTVQALATRGFAVLQVNFRGSGGYGRDFEIAGHRQWGRTMQDDVTDATRWAIESGKVDPDKVAIYGNSYGGYAALMGAAREPELYRCAISYVGVSDLPLMYDSDIQDSRWGKSYLRMVLGEDNAELEANSPSRMADRIKAKVFLVHGQRDERVPVKNAELMRDALRKAGNEPEWYVEADEEHGFAKPESVEQLYQRVDGFLRGCLDV